MKNFEEEKKIFFLVANKISKKLTNMDFSIKDFSGENIFSFAYEKDSLSYVVEYNFENKTFILKNQDGETFSSWLFDKESDLEKQAKSISKDFSDYIISKFYVYDPDSIGAKEKRIKKKRKNENSETDPIFLINRIANLFPEVKDKIAKEKDEYSGNIRAIIFTKEKILPVINSYLSSGLEETKLKKLSAILNGLYKAGDLDTRAIITMIILNSIEKKHKDEIKKHLEEELKKSWQAAEKVNWQDVAPEKTRRSLVNVAKNLESKR